MRAIVAPVVASDRTHLKESGLLPSMAEHRPVEAPRAATHSPFSILYLTAAAVLCGVGILTVQYWILLQNWTYFVGVLPLTGGALMLFTRGTGADRA